jgi:hypothetical protein
MLVFLKRVGLKKFEWCWKREKVLCKKVVQEGACVDCGLGFFVTSWPGLNRINRILISTSCNFFSGSSSEKNSRLSVFGLEQSDDG